MNKAYKFKIYPNAKQKIIYDVIVIEDLYLKAMAKRARNVVIITQKRKIYLCENGLARNAAHIMTET